MTLFGLNVSWTNGRLPFSQLHQLFKQYGATEVGLKNESSVNEGGQAFVTFGTQEEALTALQKTNGSDIGGVTLTVEVLENPEYSDFEIVEKLFGGAMGKTFLVRHKQTGQLYVMKRVDYHDENDKKMVDDEIAQMKQLSSRYTVQLMWSFVDRTDIDIKPENIFIMEDGSARLGDFGLSKQLMDKNYYARAEGTKFYLAPEVYLDGKMYFESDIYALGIVIYELISGTYPFSAGNEQEIIENIIKGKRAELPNWVPDEMKKLISNMLNIV
ncbi:MAG: putative G2-specific protein kinase nimA [Streblomastix strix]|uniref:non-specific serine/threonine protein kinase n=1 Tax=Streblomastix strix TaxID=222440 RepID=A0A5J4W073_9EUKA|nr:MAG: putative G2-specific protein kinase nimA [Streblomastix strix]